MPEHAKDLPERANFDLVVMSRPALIEKMKENRDKHKEDFDHAVEGYAVRAREVLEEKLTALSKGSKEQIFVHLPFPEDHTADYDAYIQALECQTFPEVRLPMNEWRCYYMDEWNWKRSWSQSNSDYLTSYASTR